MLILGRKIGERVFIGDDIIVTVTKIEKGQVKLGIAAPAEIAVHREEIYNKIRKAEESRDTSEKA